MSKRIAISFLLFFVIIVSMFNGTKAFAAEGSAWINKNAIPENLAYNSLISLNNNLFSFGGNNLTSGAINSVYKYDQSSDSWIKKTSMPTARYGSAASVVNNKVYVIGGSSTGINAVEEYDPSSDSWIKKANLPTTGTHITSTVLNNKIYVGGGKVNNLATKFESYDPTTDTWTTQADMLSNRDQSRLATFNNKIYSIGGSATTTIDEYDPLTNTWSTKLDLGRKISLPSVVTDSKYIYIIGGKENSEALNTLTAYNPKDNSVSNISNFSTARYGFGAATINSKLYIVAGNLGSSYTNSVEEYDILNGQPTNPTEPSSNRAILTITMITGLEKEFDLSMSEVQSFITWYETKETGIGPATFVIDKHNNNKGPFSKRSDYVIFKNILSFEVDEYEIVE